MIKCNSKKAQKIKKILEQRTGEKIDIYKGRPDARFKEGYFAYRITGNGFHLYDYGILIKNSKTLKGLLEEDKPKDYMFKWMYWQKI